jgi:thiamine biosynthesis lipoprotein
MRPAGHARWNVWGTYAFLAVADAEQLPRARRITDQLLAAVDGACSRFRWDSTLSEVNRRPGSWVAADPLLVAALEVALDAAAVTDGLVDPCLGRTMVSLGYDRDLAELTLLPTERVTARVDPPPPGAWREVRVAEDAVRIPEGVALDLGATAKAWAADLVAETLVDALGCPVVVSLGGDLRVLGPDPDEAAAWPVQVAERPDEVSSGATVSVSGGLATSSTLVRRWSTAAGDRHHLLDPRTGLPASGVFRTVTAAGSTCVAANTASTAALVLGAEAPAWLRRHGVTARLIDVDGTVTTVGDWPTPSEEAA